MVVASVTPYISGKYDKLNRDIDYSGYYYPGWSDEVSRDNPGTGLYVADETQQTSEPGGEETIQTQAPNETVCINTASAEELARVLPGIGEVKAARIVEYRLAVGGFNSVDELIGVNGIGEKTIENIRPYCTL